MHRYDHATRAGVQAPRSSSGPTPLASSSTLYSPDRTHRSFGPSSPPSSSICRADARKAILSATPAASDVPPHLHGVSVQSGKGPPWLEVSEAFSELVKKAACVWPLADVEASDFFYCVTSPGWLAGHACPLISRSRFLSITPLRDEIHAMSAQENRVTNQVPY